MLGAKESKEGDETTGGGLAWGSGCSPSLTKDLVMFTDNQNPVNLLAVDMKTGEKVASHPVIDELPEEMYRYLWKIQQSYMITEREQ